MVSEPNEQHLRACAPQTSVLDEIREMRGRHRFIRWWQMTSTNGAKGSAKWKLVMSVMAWSWGFPCKKTGTKLKIGYMENSSHLSSTRPKTPRNSRVYFPHLIHKAILDSAVRHLTPMKQEFVDVEPKGCEEGTAHHAAPKIPGDGEVLMVDGATDALKLHQEFVDTAMVDFEGSEVGTGEEDGQGLRATNVLCEIREKIGISRKVTNFPPTR
ncbi:hypothetical protein B0H16DRAFT_1459769 [Mycena metata]|uniref:Uncharacterized protein n=1 Tax=Mycena metata TaxID=1033252 RepID=A0AAD7IZJ3_9AGAR|nr:hypothetical protein B0H16DRAFT_1459769 [Mycena metata]